jgi:hypothetical protein
MLCAGVVLASVGCGTTADPAPDPAVGAPSPAALGGPAQPANTVVSVVLADGRTVSFVSPEPGVVTVQESGPLGATPAVKAFAGERLDAVALYERISGKTAPEALVTATRATIAPAEPGERAVKDDEPDVFPSGAGSTNPVDGVGQTTEALSNGLTPDQFASAFCTATDDSKHFNWLFVTGTGSLTRMDVHDFQSAVLGIDGTVHFVAKYRPWFTWRNISDTDVPAGWYLYAFRPDGSANDWDSRATTSEADGDTYSMCTHF